ncbi:MAG: peptidylprolyl isomerase [Thermoplasmata archaeon]|nr:MAG: peptidylprolyl isomerase [Thermoplasmata archaeon]
MARKRRRGEKKRTTKTTGASKAEKERGDFDKKLKSTKTREERRARYKRKQDFVLFGIMFILILAIVGGYVLANEYFLNGDSDSDSQDYYQIPSSPGDSQSIYDFPTPNPSNPSNTVVVMEIRDYGSIVMELEDQKVPNTVANFKKYVQDGFYDGLIIHRVAQNPKVVQGGGYYPGMNPKDATYDPIDLEIDNSLTHVDGALAMARTFEINSATAQFYISVGENHGLDDANMIQQGDRGYAVFGQVISGHDIYRTINSVAVKQGTEEPASDIIIQRMYVYQG